MSALIGETEIEVTTAEVTVNVVDPEIAPSVAKTVVLPVASALASPWVGALPLMVAAVVLDDPQVTLAVRFCVLPSL